MTDLLALAEQSNISVEYHDLCTVESMAAPIGGRYYIGLDYALSRNSMQERIHLAHELGHCETGSFYNLYAVCDIREKHEVRADRWAYRQLIPVDELYMAMDRGYRELWELAEYFDVPGEFMYRAIEYYRLVLESA